MDMMDIRVSLFTRLEVKKNVASGDIISGTVKAEVGVRRRSYSCLQI